MSQLLDIYTVHHPYLRYMFSGSFCEYDTELKIAQNRWLQNHELRCRQILHVAQRSFEEDFCHFFSSATAGIGDVKVEKGKKLTVPTKHWF